MTEFGFQDLGHSQVIIVEDDLEVAPDFFDYFEATLPILRADQGQARFGINLIFVTNSDHTDHACFSCLSPLL